MAKAAEDLSREETPLDRIAAVFSLTRTELARLFGVRRQALDQWESRGVPSARQAKLATLGEITDLLVIKLKRDRIPGVVRRSASAYGGRSPLDAIADGDEELVLSELRDTFDWTTTPLGSGEERIPPPLTCIGAFSSGRSDLSELASEMSFEPRSWRS
jgi:DNA-binding XRE family transcriptional regulator